MPKEMPDIGFADPMKAGGIGAYQMNEWVNGQKITFKNNPRYTSSGRASRTSTTGTIL